MLLTTLFLFLENPKTIIFIVFVLVLFFGAKRIPEMMRGLGQGVREFKDATKPQPEQPMHPGGYASQNPNNYPPQTAPYGQPDYQAQQYPAQPQQYPAQQNPGYQPSAPAPQIPPATSYPDASNQSIS